MSEKVFEEVTAEAMALAYKRIEELESGYEGQRYEIKCLEERCDRQTRKMNKLEEERKEVDKRVRFLEECLIKAGLG